MIIHLANIIPPLVYNAIGYGWGSTVLALVAIAIGCPAVRCEAPERAREDDHADEAWLSRRTQAPVLFKYGERIRQSSKYAAKKVPA
jgi:hypothetical protein